MHITLLQYRLPVMLGIAFLLVFQTSLQAVWYGEHGEERDGIEGEIIMMDVRWPYWPEPTYFAVWNAGFEGFPFYGGYAASVAPDPETGLPNRDLYVQERYRPQSVWSFWGANKETGEPVRIVASSERTYPYQYIGEGASGSCYGPSWPVRAGVWHTMLMRAWNVPDPDDEYSYLGRWRRDGTTGRWEFYGIAKIPLRSKYLKGNMGFIEGTSPNVNAIRTIHRGAGFHRRDGVWHKTNRITIDMPPANNEGSYQVAAGLIENGTALGIEMSNAPEKLPYLIADDTPLLEGGKRSEFRIEQADEPTLDPFEMEDVSAVACGSQVLVSWDLSERSTPQLGYSVEIFADIRCVGEPRAIRKLLQPTDRSVLVDGYVPGAVVRFTARSIFDQISEPVVLTPDPCDAIKRAVAATESNVGLRYNYFTKDEGRRENVFYVASDKLAQSVGETHYWTSLSEFETATLVRSGIASGFDIRLRGRRREGFGFQFEGLLEVPETGLYRFEMEGASGYRIRFHSDTVLEWDGLHGPASRSFPLHLERGLHPVSLDYFSDTQQPYLKLRWQGPGISEQEIPARALRHLADPTVPQVDFIIAGARQDGRVITCRNLEIGVGEDGSELALGMVTIRGSLRSNGQKIERLLFLHEGAVVAEIDRESLQRGEFVWTGLFPAGKAELRSRIIAANGFSVDSVVIPIDVPRAPVKGFRVANVGEKNLAYNIQQTAPDAFRFVGTGEYVVNVPVEGDFTMVCRVDSYLGRLGELVESVSMAGLAARENCNNPAVGAGQSFELRFMAKDGLHATPNHGDFGGVFRCVSDFPSDRPWIRIVRQGREWSAWCSADGKEWTYLTTHYKDVPQAMEAGILFRVQPGAAEMLFRAEVSDFKIVPGTPPGIEVSTSQATGTAGVTMTGVVVAPSNPDVVVVRTSDRGILRSVDRGTSWASANGKLKGAANAVRSVAIHPVNPEIMIRAAGVKSDGRFEGGLFRTMDGGRSWSRLDFDGDFDGAGPSALCGEVLAFLPNSSDTLIVGTETGGMFRSIDGGTTWERCSPDGHRITTVLANRFIDQPGKSYVYAASCPDGFLLLLGRGPSAFGASDPMTRFYYSENGGASFVNRTTHDDFGYLNLSCTNYNATHINAGTTHGLEMIESGGHYSYLFSQIPKLDGLRPIIAVGDSYRPEVAFVSPTVQAVNPVDPKAFSQAYYFNGENWVEKRVTARTDYRGSLKLVPKVPGKDGTEREWWALGLDGLYHTDDGWASLERVGVD